MINKNSLDSTVIGLLATVSTKFLAYLLQYINFILTYLIVVDGFIIPQFCKFLPCFAKMFASKFCGGDVCNVKILWGRCM